MLSLPEWLQPPRLEDPELRERAALVNLTLLLGIAALTALLPVYTVVPELRTGLYTTTPVIATLIGGRWLLSHGWVDLAAGATIALLLAIITPLSFFAGGYLVGLPGVLVVVATMAALMIGRSAGLAVTAWAIVTQVMVFATGDRTHLLAVPTSTRTVLFAVTLIQTAVLGFIVSWGLERMRQHTALARQRAASLAEAHTRSEAAAREADEANRAKSQFLATMSHELRTPLNAILGYSEILMEELGDNQLDDASRIHHAGSHLLSLINDVLDMSKVEAGRMDLHLEPVDVAALMEDVLHTVRPLCETRGNRLDVHYDAATLWLDPRKTRQIVLNLVSNAAKFTEEGSIQVTSALQDHGLRITVTDTGIGIAPHQMEKLFQPFVQADGSTSRRYGGTGLGLALSKRFAELMHGHVEVRSEVGVGSTFEVWLPDLHHWAMQTDEGDEPLVLCVDDDLATLELLARFLRPQGFRTTRATTFAHALDQAQAHHPAFVVLDLRLPDGSGWDLHDRLQQILGPGTPTIFVSAMDPPTEPLPAGVVAYLVKPLQPQSILDVLERAALHATDPGEPDSLASVDVSRGA